jgi:hypothetical protein
MMLADTVLDAAALNASASKIETTVRYQPLQWTLSDIGLEGRSGRIFFRLTLQLSRISSLAFTPCKHPHGTAACIDPIVRA